MALGNINQNEDYIAEINMTPLVDVMLVLMIIFLITAPILTQTINIDLPKTEKTTAKTINTPLNITLNKEGKIFWENSPINSLKELRKRLIKSKNSNNELKIFLSADKNTKYDSIAPILVMVQSLNISNINLVTEIK